MRKSAGFWLLVLFGCLVPAHAASTQPTQISLESQLEALFANPQQPIFASCTATANCSTGAIGCSGPTSCTGVDQNCSIGQQGYVQCGSSIQYCPGNCGSGSTDCNSLNQQFPGCNYTYYAAGDCCITPVQGCPEPLCLE